MSEIHQLYKKNKHTSHFIDGIYIILLKKSITIDTKINFLNNFNLDNFTNKISKDEYNAVNKFINKSITILTTEKINQKSITRDNIYIAAILYTIISYFTIITHNIIHPFFTHIILLPVSFGLFSFIIIESNLIFNFAKLIKLLCCCK